MAYAFFDNLGDILFIYNGNVLGDQVLGNAHLDFVIVDDHVNPDDYWIPDVNNPGAALLPECPGLFHAFDYVVREWVVPVNAMAVAAEQRIRAMQDEIFSLQREPVTSVKSDDLSATSLYFATDHFRALLANPERIGVDGSGGVMFWGADGYVHTVGIGWFDGYNPLVAIYKRDSLLDAQLFNARLAVLALVDDANATVMDIVNYDPGFTLPTYPYD